MHRPNAAWFRGHIDAGLPVDGGSSAVRPKKPRANGVRRDRLRFSPSSRARPRPCSRPTMRTTSGGEAGSHWQDRQHRLPASSLFRAQPRMRARQRRGRALHLDPQAPLRATRLLFQPSARTRRAWSLPPIVRGAGRRPSLSRLQCGRRSGHRHCEPCCRRLVRPPAVDDRSQSFESSRRASGDRQESVGPSRH